MNNTFALVKIGLMYGLQLIIKGFVFAYIWKKFMLPVFFFLPELTLVKSIGLIIIFTFITMKFEDDFELSLDPDEAVRERLAALAMTAANAGFIYFVAFIVTMFG